MILSIFAYRFMQYALISAFLASMVCGVVGVIIVEKKLVMMTGGIAHTSYGGVGLGYLLGFEPILGAFLFAVAAALGIGTIKNRNSGMSDIVIALFWALGMALGIFFIGLMPGYPPTITTYLFGNILSVTTFDLILMGVLTIVVLFLIVVFFQDWKAYLFDPDFTKLSGKRVGLLENTLLILIALSVVVLIRVVGIVLVIALLTAPAAPARLVSRKLTARMGWSILFSLIYSVAGLLISTGIEIASGAVIVFFSIFSYVVVYAVVAWRKRRKAVLKKGVVA